MKKEPKSKPKSGQPETRLPMGMQKTRVVSKSRFPEQKESKVFTPMETGQPDTQPVPGFDNPGGVQGGLGPLNQEGEGERQNDQLAELEQIEPEG